MNRPVSPQQFETFCRIIETGENPQSEKFFYGVRTTGIYCRPGCSSRTPLRQNMIFFHTARDAEAAGFRPCRRCRPADPAGSPVPAVVLEACRMIEEAHDEIPLSELAASAGLSAGYFQKLFKRTTGLTPKEYAGGLKAGRFRNLLGRSANVTEALYEAGYGSSSRVYEQTEKLLSMKPSHYRKAGLHQKIRFAVAACALGYIAAAFSEKGVCSIDLGDSEEDLTRLVRDRFRKAELSELREEEKGFFREVIAKAGHPGNGGDLLQAFPSDIRGTIFQEKVWKALRQIPPGETRSYANIAEEIGRPSAVRAVANACGRNPLALVIPCHRVIRRNGDPGGYRWGEEKKRKILSQEKREQPGGND